MALLTSLDVARRIASLAGIVILVALAAALLWRVYLHHSEADPYEREEPATVEVRRSTEEARKNCGGVELNCSASAITESGTTAAISSVRRKQIT